MNRVSQAFDSMIRQIDEGREFPCAHANVVGRFALTDKQSLEVIAMYDSLCSETKSEGLKNIKKSTVRMKNLTAQKAIKIASQFIENGKVEDAKHVLDFWQKLKLNGDVIMTLDESNNKEYMSLGFDNVDLGNL